jgi:hypothetical protein
VNFFRLILNKLPTKLYVYVIETTKNLKKREMHLSTDGKFVKINSLKKNLTWYVHRDRLHLYLDGLEQRGNSIGKSYMLDDIKFKDGDVILDCGANMGDLQLYFYSKKIVINYIGFEPNPLDYN